MSDSGLTAGVTFEYTGHLAEVCTSGQEDFRSYIQRAPGPRKALQDLMGEPIMGVEDEKGTIIFSFDTKETLTLKQREELVEKLGAWLVECEAHYHETYVQQGTTYREACEAARSKVIVRPTKVALAVNSDKSRH